MAGGIGGFTMRELPIILTAANARKSREGTKTQTRRLHNLERINAVPDYWACTPTMDPNIIAFVDRASITSGRIESLIRVKPYYLAGELLWAKETIMLPPPITPRLLREGADTWPTHYYRADLDKAQIEELKEWGWKVKTARFMDKIYTRDWYRVKSWRAERLKDISEADCIAEGIVKDTWEFNTAPYRSYIHTGINSGRSIPQAAFMDLWNAINLKTFPWSMNPWVFVYEYEKLETYELKGGINKD